MKIILLCGGLGTRLAEETKVKPKPMVKIGSEPILIHLINYYKKFGFKEFVLALGYKGYVIKDYFKKKKNLKQKIILADTGKSTLTGGRLLRLKKYIDDNEDFMLTYGDGLSNVNLKKLLYFHKKHNKICTLTAVRPQARFGELTISNNSQVKKFEEKPQTSQNWINGGFFVFKKDIFKYLKNDNTVLERYPLQMLTREKQLMAYKHPGFWQCMDTLRDKNVLNDIWKRGRAPWKI